MKIQSSFEVQAPAETAFAIVTDVQRVAPCFPGARLNEKVDDDTYKGEVSVRLGPVNVNFSGRLQFVERNPAELSARLRARGKEKQGRGAADAKIAMRLEPAGDITRVVLDTDLNLAGPVAQYGRGAGVLEKVAEVVLDEFARNLEKSMAGGDVDAGNRPLSGARVLGRAVINSLGKSDS